MPAARKNDWGRSIVLTGCTLGAWGWMMVGSAHAQPADPGKPVPPAAAASQSGGLDMDVNPTAPAMAASQNQPGGLDLDVNPVAPAPAPVVEEKNKQKEETVRKNKKTKKNNSIKELPKVIQTRL